MTLDSSSAEKRLVFRQANADTLYFPPQDGTETVPLQVRVGDLLNVTWATNWQGVDIHMSATAPGTNFTVKDIFPVGLDGTGSNAYRLQPRDYYIDDPSAVIQAFFHLVQTGVDSEFINSQNFTIAQPLHPDQLDFAGIPLEAATWTGSVTLMATGTDGQLQPTTPPGASFGKATTGQSSPTGAPDSSVSSPTASPTGITAPALQSGISSSQQVPSQQVDGLTTGQKAGIGVGVALGALLILGLAMAVFVLARKHRAAKRNNQDQEQHAPTTFPTSEKAGWSGSTDSNASATNTFPQSPPHQSELSAVRQDPLEMGTESTIVRELAGDPGRRLHV